MEARVCYQKDTIKQFGDIIMQYQDWHQYDQEAPSGGCRVGLSPNFGIIVFCLVRLSLA